MNPVNAISFWFARKAQLWLAKKVPVVSSISLHRKNIFILPTTHGLLFAAATILVFVTAINYILSLAFALAFLMVSVFVLSILHAFRNLQHLNVRAAGAEPVFAGEDATFVILLQRNAGRFHEILELFFPKGLTSHANLLDGDQERVNVYLPTHRRGLLKAPRLRVQTRFPLGLWCAWSTLDLGMSCLVYPAPVASTMPGAVTASHSGKAESTHPGTEDFHGLRSYQPGDSLKHVAWKNLARGQGLKVKQFVDNVDDRFMLDWEMYHGLDTEERLSRLCYWVLSLSRSNVEYGLRLPGVDIPIGRGDAHRERLLSALALWNLKVAHDQGREHGGEGTWT
ncbi:MAG: DUF58 domain-containing protein [Gammaproteobacteria bacterium]|nr:DUF58 domain-containing protein [Gammaproteobacteria bacterium]MDP2139215.1 DUF58 domain-containing protein [Gammaproteobacteria bacterium]MDP2349016.1 DUF58 domain-containing protein [Gammaproteobacteria bacterium]